MDALNHKLGTDRPRLEQYIDLLKGIVTFDFGDSYQSGQPVGDLIKTTLQNSAKLAILALLITVPLGIFAGTMAALRRDTVIDRVIVMLGLAGSSLPEFVTSTFLVVVLGLQLDLLPTLANWPPGANIFTQIHYLLMPALALVLVYFGYIARMARAGMIVAMESDYTRTAMMKGLSRGRVIRRHVLRNALLPTIAVVATSDRVSVRRAAGGRADLQHQRPRPAAGDRRQGQGPAGAAGRRAGDRHHLHVRDPDRRHPDLVAEPTDPAGE